MDVNTIKDCSLLLTKVSNINEDEFNDGGVSMAVY